MITCCGRLWRKVLEVFFDKSLALFHYPAANATDAIWEGCRLFREAGISLDGYEDSVIRREEKFPTGIETGGIGVAIPHTDSKYVSSSQIAFLSLAKPVSFRFMGDRTHEVPVSLVFLLGMSSPNDQIDILSNLLGLCQKQEALTDLLSCENVKELKGVLARYDIS